MNEFVFFIDLMITTAANTATATARHRHRHCHHYHPANHAKDDYVKRKSLILTTESAKFPQMIIR